MMGGEVGHMNRKNLGKFNLLFPGMPMQILYFIDGGKRARVSIVIFLLLVL